MLLPVPTTETKIVWFTAAMEELQNIIAHIDLKHSGYGLRGNSLYYLLPEEKSIESWSQTDIDKWCDDVYQYLKRARTEIAVAAYLAQLWKLDTHHKQSIIKHVATRFKTGHMTYKLGLEQKPWNI